MTRVVMSQFAKLSKVTCDLGPLALSMVSALRCIDCSRCILRPIERTSYYTGVWTRTPSHPHTRWELDPQHGYFVRINQSKTTILNALNIVVLLWLIPKPYSGLILSQSCLFLSRIQYFKKSLQINTSINLSENVLWWITSVFWQSGHWIIESGIRLRGGTK